MLTPIFRTTMRRLLRVVQRTASATSRPPASEKRRTMTVDKGFREFIAEAKEDKPAAVEEEEEEMEEMFVDTKMGKEWGGPMRGGRHPEPTRFGDWERKGRASDF